MKWGEWINKTKWNEMKWGEWTIKQKEVTGTIKQSEVTGTIDLCYQICYGVNENKQKYTYKNEIKITIITNSFLNY